jgi:cytochrome c-type biogenesis protein CcmH/NrfG
LGQVLIEQEKWQEASRAYRMAIRVGPQGTAMAYYMMGQCYEQLKDNESAAEAYLASLDLEPNGIAAAEKLAQLSPGLNSPSLTLWSSRHLDQLNRLEQEELEKQEAIAPMPVYKQYEGVLGKEK